MAAEGMQFPWGRNGGTISLNLGVIWEMSAKGEKRHADVIGAAVRVMKIATGQIQEDRDRR